MSTPRVDPITTEIIRNAFLSAASDMKEALIRSAHSPVIYEMEDCGVGLFNENAETVGQAAGLASFLGTLSPVIELVTQKLGRDSYRPGDVIIVNDSYIIGTHLNDVVIFSPIFCENELVGFAANKAHWRDIGSKDVGFVVDTTEIYQEGIRISPMKLYDQGRLNQTLVDLLTMNARFPDSLLGDMHAQVASCRLGERRFVEIVERFGLTTVRDAMADVFDASEAAERRAIAEIPDGVYYAEGWIDNDFVTNEPFKVCATVTVHGTEITVDNTGTSPQRKGPTNCGFVNTLSACRVAYKFVICPLDPVSGGSFRPLTVKIEPGTVAAAQEPAACQQFGPHSLLMADLILRALGQAVPHKVTAGLPGCARNVFIDGWDPGLGRRFVSGEANPSGWGASAFGDGESGVVHLTAGDFKNIPAETQEIKFPLLITQYQLRPDSGGPGKFRGGLGIIKEYEALADGTLSLWFERSVTPQWGVFGGKDGAPPRVVVGAGRPDETVMLKASHRPLPTGTIVTAYTSGGGGYGPPWERDPQLVRRDCLNGYVSREAAATEYGVIFWPDSLEIDTERTAKRRSELAAQTESYPA